MNYSESVEKPKLTLNSEGQKVVNYLAREINKHSKNPIEDLTPRDISYIQTYLEQLKIKKINKTAVPSNLKYCTSYGDSIAKSRILREMTAKEPINPHVNDNNYGSYPFSRDIENPLPSGILEIPKDFPPHPERGLSSDYVPVLSEFRNGYGPGTGINHKLSVRPKTHMMHQNDKISKQQNSNRINDLYNPIENMSTHNIPNQTATRLGKKSAQIENFDNCSYFNPYEYGAKQNELGSLMKPTYVGPYDNNSNMMNELGLSDNLYWEKFPGDQRNVNVESSLLQREMTHTPGQRELTEREVNRFQMLPFDPQDTRHIIWKDNMPRGGYPTRVDRLETI
uniref:Uncharacterized protein n=1 Tax=viral metagenome TaxID=1070528 RepID=A0A6C0LRG5_9ZZZZ